MGTLNLSGISTGIDTATIVNQLIAAESGRLNRYKTQLNSYESENSAIGELENKVTALRTSVKALSDSKKLVVFNTKTSNEDILELTASNNALEGTHSIQVKQLAAGETWIQNGNEFDYATDYVGGGKFIYTYNSQQCVITATDGETTVQDLVDRINNDKNNPGVTASLLYRDGKYRVMLSGRDTGEDYQITLHNESSELWSSKIIFLKDGVKASSSEKLINLDGFSGSLIGGEKITISGTDHNGTAIASVDLNVNRYTTIDHIIDKINEAFDGIAKASYKDGVIKLFDMTEGTSGLSINLTWIPGVSEAALTLPDESADWTVVEGGADTAGGLSTLAGSFIETRNAQNSKIKIDGYPPAADECIERNSNVITDVLTGVELKLHSITNGDDTVEIGVVRNISDIKTKLQSLMMSYNELIQYIKNNTEYDSDEKKMGTLSRNLAVSMIKNQVRTPFLSNAPGFNPDSDTFTKADDIGITINNKGLMEIDQTKFEDAVEEDLQATLDLLGVNDSGSSDDHRVEYYASTVNTAAGEYDVKITTDENGLITGAYIKLASEDDSAYRAANYNNENGIITVPYNNGHPEAGLQIKFNTDGLEHNEENPVATTLRVRQGFASSLNELLDDIAGFDGRLSVSREMLEDRIESQNKKIEKEQQRLDDEKQRLVAKFARLEKNITLLQNQMAQSGLLTGMTIT